VVYLGPTPCDEARTLPIPWAPEFYHTLKLTKRNNDIIREECRRNKINFIDLFSEWSKADYKKLLDDGIHPTAEGHQKIFKTVSAFLVKNGLL
jgi:lysophospholipase L1-like esterase